VDNGHAHAGQWVISARGLGKCYHIYDRPIARLWQILFGRWRRFHRKFWALRGVDLDIRRGETVGIIGKNGSGKSTFLQVVAGTSSATEGGLRVNGRVAALLELGSGFDMEFSGRENVFMNAALLGLSRDEIVERFPRMEAFADLGDFIDQPVRTYSSGMVVRLAFAVAINTDPDILIIDEALAVGDEAFQRKCYARLEGLKKDGTTILFVSHSPSSIVELCDRGVLIDAGERLLTGHPKTVVQHYQRLLYALPEEKERIRGEIRAMDGSVKAFEVAPENDTPAGQPAVKETMQTRDRYDPGMVAASAVELPRRGACIVDPHLENLSGERVNVLQAGGDYVYVYDVEFTGQCRQVIFGMLLKSVSGIELFGMASHARGDAIAVVEPGARIRVRFRFATQLRPGAYFLNAGCMGLLESGEVEFLHRIFDAVMFRIELPETDRMNTGFYDLAIEPACDWLLMDVVA
jgi:lipopolysaccharide transport system ATP-binding protein